MTDRLIPYRSVARRETEASAEILVGLVGGFVTQQHAPAYAFFGVVGAYYAATLLYGLWARVARFERVTSDEQQRRDQLERAQRPLWIEAVNWGASTGALMTGLAVFGLRPEDHGALPLFVTGSFLAGAFFGLYLAVDARRAVKGTPCQRVSFAESTGRHVAGYATGLAGALAAATLIDNASLSIGAMLAAFLSAKFAIDMFLATGVPPCIEADDEPLKWYHIPMVFPAGAIWWGVPFGALSVLVTLTATPDASWFLLVFVFVGTLIVIGALATFATVMAVLMGLYPRQG